MEEAHEKDKQIEEEEEEEFVLLDLDDCLYSDIPPNAPYVLSGLDTMTPTLIIGDHLKLVGEYQETVGTCYLFSESDASLRGTHSEITHPEENKDESTNNSKQAPTKEVKHLASLHKILKFRPIDGEYGVHSSGKKL